MNKKCCSKWKKIFRFVENIHFYRSQASETKSGILNSIKAQPNKTERLTYIVKYGVAAHKYYMILLLNLSKNLIYAK